METVSRTVKIDLGTMHYDPVLKLQHRAVELIQSGHLDEIYFFLEHFPVYTAGIHYREAKIHESINVVKVERGGGITYHGPGQVIVYPLVNLAKRKITVKDLIISMHEAVTETLADYGIDGEGRLDKETGVWAGNRKISSTGFYIRGSTTMHGIALNVNTDLSEFNRIDPCGYSPETMTSMETLTGKRISINEVKKILWEKIKVKLEISQFLELHNPEELSETNISGLLSGTVP